jgi:hypothetical protein
LGREGEMKYLTLLLLILVAGQVYAITEQEAKQIINLAPKKYFNNVCEVQLIEHENKCGMGKAYYNCNGNPLQYKVKIYICERLSYYEYRNTLYHELGHIEYFNLPNMEKIKVLSNIWKENKCFKELSTYQVMEVYADRFAEAQGYYQSYNYCEGIQ